jgi:hypothetical protein
MAESVKQSSDYRFCQAEESKLLSDILNKYGNGYKRTVGKLITEFSSLLKHIHDSNIPIKDRRKIINMIRTNTINKLYSYKFPKEIETFTINVLHIIYVNKIL